VHARLHDDTEEAELGAAQGRQGAPDECTRCRYILARANLQEHSVVPFVAGVKDAGPRIVRGTLTVQASATAGSR
jgi:hypothetical protein